MVSVNSVGTYCKAIYLGSIRSYLEDRADSEFFRDSSDETVLYLHDNYMLTKSIDRDIDIVYSSTSDDWIEYCKSELAFKIPEFA